MTDADGCQSVGQLDVAGGVAVAVAAAVVVINFFSYFFFTHRTVLLAINCILSVFPGIIMTL